MAGYVTEYDTNGFKFVTVKGSGHMVKKCIIITNTMSNSYNNICIVFCIHCLLQVPQYRPKQAYAMFDSFINNKPF